MKSPFVSGFTLIELLVSLVIIGIIFTFFSLSFRGSSPIDAIKEEASRFDRLIQIAQDEAVLQNREFGIVIKQDGYSFAKLVENRWIPVTGDRLLRDREMPEEIFLDLELEDSTISLREKTEVEAESHETVRPQIFLLSSGEIIPTFNLQFQVFGIDISYQVKGVQSGQHSAARYEF